MRAHRLFACRRFAFAVLLGGSLATLHAQTPASGGDPALVGPVPADFTPSGAVRAWGNNSNGQLGNDSTNNSAAPVAVTSANGFTNTGVTSAATGGLHSLAVQGGVAYGWGNNGNGQLGNANYNTSVTRPVAVAAANGFTNTGVTAVAAGAFHSLAIQGGAAYTWGSNNLGTLGNGTTTQSNVPVPVAAANGFTNIGVTAIAAGDSHSLAVQGGSAYAWGSNTNGQLGNGSTALSRMPVPVASANGFTNSGVTAVAGGYQHSLAIQNGAAYAWGSNSSGQLGNNSTTNSLAPVTVLSLSTGVTSIAAGGFHGLAVQNGGVFAWGNNRQGQLGNDSTVNSSTPVQVFYGGAALGGIVQVAAGNASSYALAGDGSLYVWGYNADGELGLGNTATPYLTPQHLLPPGGQYYQLIDGDSYGLHALAILGNTPPVPEPTTWIFVAAGAILLGIVTLRRRAALGA